MGFIRYPKKMANDPTTKAIIAYFNISIELIKEIAGSVVSTRVHGKSVNKEGRLYQRTDNNI